MMSAWKVYPKTGLKGFTIVTCKRLIAHMTQVNCFILSRGSLVGVRIFEAGAKDLA